MNMHELINHPEATIVDVRTPGEFQMGHVEGSINIPLNEVPERLEELRGLSRPLILCCQSGARSGQATHWLREQGLDDLYNGGGWAQVQIHKM